MRTHRMPDQIPLLCQISQNVSPRFNLLSKMIVELTFENIFQRKIILARREAVEFLSSVKFLKMSACYSIYWAKWPYSWLLRISFSAKWFSRGVKPSNSFLLVLDLSRISHHIFREHFLQNFSREHIFREYSSYISRTLCRESHILQERLEILKSLLCMGSLWLVGSFKIWVSFAEYRLFYRALLRWRFSRVCSVVIWFSSWVSGVTFEKFDRIEQSRRISNCAGGDSQKSFENLLQHFSQKSFDSQKSFENLLQLYAFCVELIE